MINVSRCSRTGDRYVGDGGKKTSGLIERLKLGLKTKVSKIKNNLTKF